MIVPRLIRFALFLMVSRALAGDGAELMTRGREAYLAGDFVLAETYFAAAATQYAQSGAVREQVAALLDQADALMARHHPGEAVTILERVTTVPLDGKSAQQARLLGSLGSAHLAIGHLDTAAQQLNASVKAAMAVDDLGTAAASSNNLGNTYIALKQYDKALQAYLGSGQLAERNQDHLLAAKALTNAARLAIHHDFGDSAVVPAEFLRSAQSHIGLARNSRDKALILIAIGQNLPSDQVEWKRGTLENALQVAQAMHDRAAISSATGALGKLYEQMGQFDLATSHTSRAQFTAQEIQRPDLLYRWQWQMGRILAWQGQIDSAINAYRRAITTLQPIRIELSAAYRHSDFSFRESVGAIFVELADLLLQRSARSSASDQDIQDLLEARQTVEQIKSVELADYFQDDCVAMLQAKTKGIDALDPKTAALYPILLPDRTELLLSLPQRIRRVTVAIPKAEMTKTVRAFRKALEKRITREYLADAQVLYDHLIRPIENELQRERIDTLIIVPDDPLRTVPLSALHDGKQFLIERYAVATTPGLTLTDPHPIQRQDVRLLLNGLSQSSQGFPALPHVEEELAGIAKLYDSEVLVNEAFRVPRLQSELSRQPFSVVHIASHGYFQSDAGQSFLLAYDDRIDMDVLQKAVSGSRFHEHPIELLTLSACQTAAGDDRAALGLAGIAIKAGARSALASLWFINDRASSLLVTAFYNRLRDPAISKARALQLAQQEMLQDKRYRHPGFWSPFLLIGNWL